MDIVFGADVYLHHEDIAAVTEATKITYPMVMK